jgi:hypothetical protein
MLLACGTCRPNLRRPKPNTRGLPPRRPAPPIASRNPLISLVVNEHNTPAGRHLTSCNMWKICFGPISGANHITCRQEGRAILHGIAESTVTHHTFKTVAIFSAK